MKVLVHHVFLCDVFSRHDVFIASANTFYSALLRKIVSFEHYTIGKGLTSRGKSRAYSKNLEITCRLYVIWKQDCAISNTIFKNTDKVVPCEKLVAIVQVC